MKLNLRRQFLSFRKRLQKLIQQSVTSSFVYNVSIQIQSNCPQQI